MTTKYFYVPKQSDACQFLLWCIDIGVENICPNLFTIQDLDDEEQTFTAEELYTLFINRNTDVIT